MFNDFEVFQCKSETSLLISKYSSDIEDLILPQVADFLITGTSSFIERFTVHLRSTFTIGSEACSPLIFTGLSFERLSDGLMVNFDWTREIY